MSTNKAKIEALLKLINSAAQEAIAEYEKVGDDVPSIDSTEPHPLDNAIEQVALKSAVRILEGACAQLCATLAPPSHTAINVRQSSSLPVTQTLVTILSSSYKDMTMRASVLFSERISLTSSRIIPTVYMSMSFQGSSTLSQRNLRVCCVFWPREAVTQKVSHVPRRSAKGSHTYPGFSVDTDTFTNNRLSLILHSENPVRHMVGLHVESATRGAAVLYETLKDSKTAYSEGPEHAPIMYVNNKEGITGTFFDWMRQEVTISFYVQSVRLTLQFRTAKERFVKR